MVNLTDRFVRSVQCVDGKRTDFADDKVKGLWLRVTPQGTRSWSILYRRRSDSKLRRLTIGQFPAFSLYDARVEAQVLLGRIARGEDPANVTLRKGATKGKPRTFGELAERYLTVYAPQKDSGAEDERILRKDVLPVLEGELLTSSESSDIAAVLDTVMRRGSPVAANRTFSATRRVFRWGIGAGLSKVNPCDCMKPPAKEQSRERVLSPEEIITFWRRMIAKTRMSWQMRFLLRFALITGHRVSEISAMRQSELRLPQAEWHIPGERMKHGLPHITPLSPFAMRLILKALARCDRDGDGNGDALVLASPVTGSSLVKAAPALAMRRAQGLDGEKLSSPIREDIFGFTSPITPHDLRRTVGTGLGRLGFSRFIQDKVLAHKDRTIGGIYDRYEYLAEKRLALEAWADHLIALIYHGGSTAQGPAQKRAARKIVHVHESGQRSTKADGAEAS
jgi:integrase